MQASSDAVIETLNEWCQTLLISCAKYRSCSGFSNACDQQGQNLNTGEISYNLND
jgi:hypothetical protein